MDSDVRWLADELEALRAEYANIRKLLRGYIRGQISHSGLILEFAEQSIRHDIRVKAEDTSSEDGS